jgi:hypothetical protein
MIRVALGEGLEARELEVKTGLVRMVQITSHAQITSETLTRL